MPLDKCAIVFARPPEKRAIGREYGASNAVSTGASRPRILAATSESPPERLEWSGSAAHYGLRQFRKLSHGQMKCCIYGDWKNGPLTSKWLPADVVRHCARQRRYWETIGAYYRCQFEYRQSRCHHIGHGQREHCHV